MLTSKIHFFSKDSAILSFKECYILFENWKHQSFIYVLSESHLKFFKHATFWLGPTRTIPHAHLHWGSTSDRQNVPEGNPNVPESVQETLKLLKRLGFPESQDSTKASSLLTKVVTSLTKRMGKLQEVKDLLEKPEISESQLAKKSLGCVFVFSCFEKYTVLPCSFIYTSWTWLYPACL